MRVELFDAYIKHKYGVTITGFEPKDREVELRAIYDWSVENFGKDNITRSFSTLYFNKESHRNLFLLMWG